MSDWMPLAERNPVPGDPWALIDLANRLGFREAVIQDVLCDLKKIDSTGYWQSPAAAGFTEVRDGVLPKLELLADRFAKTSQALRTYAESLSMAQHNAGCALHKAQCAQSAIDNAERELARKAAEPPPPVDITVVPVFTNPDPDRMALEHGQDDLSLARQLLAEAEDLRDAAAGRCAKAIEEAIDDDLRNDDGGLWGGIKRVSKKLVDNFPYVDDIARFAGLASGVLGVLSIIPPLTPFLAPAAAIAGGVSLLANSTLAAAGEQDWGPAIWDAAGLAFFGFGRLATIATRAQAGKELAAKAQYFKELRVAAQGKLAPRAFLSPQGTAKLATTGREMKAASAMFGRAARPFLGAGGQPVGRWSVLRSTASFWKHAPLPSNEILAVTPRAIRFARGARVLAVAGGYTDVRDIATDPAIEGGILRARDRVTGRGRGGPGAQP